MAARERTFQPLGEAFAPAVDTSALNQRPRPANVTPTPEPTEQVKHTPPAPKTVPPKPTPTPTPKAEIADRAVQISMPKSLAARFRSACTQTARSQPALVFDAIETTLDQLPELLRSQTTPVTSQNTLFSRDRTNTKPITDEPRETLVIRVTPHNRDILNDLVTQDGAPNRNTLLTTAIKAYLDLEQ